MAAADQRIADRLGLPADVVMIHRNTKLLEGVHFHRAEGGRIDYTAEGEAAAEAALGSKKKEGAPAASSTGIPQQKKDAAALPGEPVLLKLLRRYPNPIWIDVQSDQTRIQVRVRNNNLLSPERRVLCRQWPDGRWECCQKGQAFPLNPLAP